MIWIVIVLGSVGCGWLLGRGDAAANAAAARELSPTLLLTALLGVTAGLYGRDRVRLRRTYASPTAAYLGKAGFFAALSVACSFALSPVGWPVAALHVSAAASAAGLCVWLGNLPPKL